jgi:hypothetical protein
VASGAAGCVGLRSSAVNHVSEAFELEDQLHAVPPACVVASVILQIWNIETGRLRHEVGGVGGPCEVAAPAGEAVPLCGGDVRADELGTLIV